MPSNSTKDKIILIYKALLLLLLAGASFGLGYLTRGESNRAPIIIEKNSQ